MADTLREHPRPGSNSNGQIVSTNNDPAAALTAHPGGRYDLDTETFVAGTLKSQRGKGGGGIGPEETLVAAPLTKGSATGKGVNQPGRRQEDDVNIVVAPPLVSRSSRGNAQGNSPGHNADAVVAVSQLGWNWQTGGDFRPMFGEQAPALQKNQTTAVGVRRLTPTECERLQGFDDGWTQLGGTPDSRRYSALGDAVTVNVANWIGQRLAQHSEAETGVDSQPPTSPQGDTSRRKEDATP